MNIRIAENKNDALSASSIYAMSWKAGYKGIFSDQLLWDIPLDFWLKYFESNYETRRFEIAILSVDGKDVGAGGYGLSRDYQDDTWGEITSIYFLPEAWGKTLSKHLFDFMITELRRAGCSKIHVWVLRDNLRAQRFYEKCGFCKTGNEKSISFKGEQKVDIEYAIKA